MLSYSSSRWREGNWPEDLPRELEFQKGRIPLFEYLSYFAQEFPDRPALVFYGTEITYKKWHGMSNSIAQYLIKKGLKKGEPVGLFLPSFPGFAIVSMGISKAGGVITACSPAYKELELEYQLKDAGVKIFFCLDQYMDVVRPVRERLCLNPVIVMGYSDFLDLSALEDAPAEVSRERSYFSHTTELMDIISTFPPIQPHISINIHDDLALLQYSGGTTGLPKGAMHTFFSQTYKAACVEKVFLHGLYDEKCSNRAILQLAPLYHMGGMIYFNAYFYKGLTQIIIPQFSAIETLRAIHKNEPEAIWASTPMILAMLKHPDIGKYNLRSIKRVRISGLTGIKLSEEIETQWRIHIGVGADITEGSYGLTETHSGDTFTPLGRPTKWGSVGIPAHGVEIKIVSLEDRNNVLPPEQIGEIAVYSPCNFKGYWKNPEETSKTLIDGWVFTGDVGRFDTDGYLYFLGRSKEMIKVSGYSVFPEEVEAILNRHWAVERSAVRGIADEKKGEVTKAAVLLKKECIGKVHPDDIIEWAKMKMAYYKVPKIVEFRESIPKHAGTGKILRRFI